MSHLLHLQSRIVHYVARAFIVISLLLTINLYVVCQSTSSTDGATPAALQPGAPAGSYALSGFDNINLYNGSLNFRLPLLSVAGRGGAGSVVTLPIERKWRVTDLAISQPDGSFSHHYLPIPSWWSGLPLRYTPGTLEGRKAGYDVFTCPDNTTIYSLTLTRLTFTAPDGTEYELRDDLTKGQASNNQVCNYLNPPSRGTVFITADGTSATFVSDETIYDQVISPQGGEFFPSGFLTLRDGTRYRIASGKVDWVRDRNGNKITYGYDVNSRVITITDSLNRVASISYAAGGTSYDQISFNGFGGTPRTIRVNYASMSTVLHSGTPQTYRQLFPELDGSTTTAFNPTVISSVTLPNNQQYQFRYNVYGELARVILPTGGAFEYDYAGGYGGADASGVTCCGVDGSLNVFRRVVERRIYPDGATGGSYESKMTYTPEGTTGNPGYVLVEHFKQGSTTPLAQQKHYFYGEPTNSFANLPTDYSPWKDGREYQTESFDFINNTPVLIRKVVHTWSQPVSGSTWPLGQAETNDGAKPNDPQITQTVSTLVDTNQVTKQTFSYGQYCNQTDVREYDYGTGASSIHPVRHTHTDYLTINPVNSIDYTGIGVHIRSLPGAQQTYSVNPSTGAETLVGQSETKYDETALLPWYGTVQSWVDPTGARGNPTKVRRWLNPGNVWIEARAQFDQVGNVTKTWDAKNNQTEITYSATCHFAYPTQTTSAVPDPTGQYGSTTALVTTSAYDFSTGLVTSTTDANGQTTNILYNDALDRPTQVSRAVGTSAQNQTTFAYNDATRSTTTTNDLNAYNDNLLKSEMVYDGLGRTTETRQYEGGTDHIAVRQVPFVVLQDGANWLVASQTSNPFRPHLGEQPVWTTSFLDALSRVIKVKTPDNSQVTTSYIGNAVTVTDQIGKKRKSVTDALGRLKEVYEDPTGLNYLTSYAYDALDNLTTVTQGSQTRTFAYDSFKRLTSATNPESGTITYQYDNNGNLTLKTDARAVSITYAYDALNRNTTVNHSDTTGINPDITRVYDGAIKGKGRFWYNYAGGNFSTGSNVEHTAIDSYDALGRPLIQRQLFKLNSVWGPTYQISRGYNRAGGVTTQTYPSDRAVAYNYDAAGRLGDKDSLNLAFTGNLGGVPRTYSSGIVYSSLGGMAKEQFGTDVALYNKSFYNSRGQLAEMRVGTTYTGSGDSSWNRGAIINHYSNAPGAWGATGGGPDNNGNLKRQEHWIPKHDQPQPTLFEVATQEYDYDNLNRLQRLHEGTMLQQEYVYDRYGNRTIHQTNSWGVGINKKDFTVNTANNRLGVPGGQTGTMTYDNAGNLTNDTYTGAGSRTYDAENRMTQAWGGNNQQQFYTYNAGGQRTRRKVDGVETWQICGMDGELLAEYPANGATASPQKEYGYRNGQLLITAAQPTGGGTTENAVWTNVVGATVSGNSLTKTAATAWGNAGAASTRSIVSGNGYVEFRVTSLYTGMVALSHTDANQDYTSMEFALLPNSDGNLYVFESGVNRGVVSTYTTADVFRVAVEGGVVKYRKNGTLVYTSTVAPVYPLLVDAGLYHNGGTQANVVISGNLIGGSGGGGSTANINWLVADQLGTPRMIIDKSGSLANVKRHDYLPFGEELYASQGVRTTALGYTGDSIRQKFTLKERDNETGLDYFGARYYASMQGRFTSADEPLADQDEDDPQSWNLYQYAGNNPLLFTDPTGMWKWVDPDNNGNRFLQWEEGDDWHTLAKFLNQNSDDTYRSEDLEQAFSGGGLGEGTIVDVTGAIPKFTDSRGGVDSSVGWDLVPFGGGARVAQKAGIFGRIARAFGFGAVRNTVKIPARIALPVLNAVCFVAGTPVMTKDGLKPIEEIKEGERVLSYNEQTKQTEYKTVVRTIVRFAEAENLLLVKVEGEVESLGLTDEHPFYVRIHRARDNTASENDDGEWREAGKLQVGDLIRKSDRTWAKVENISQRSEGETVYNFEVPDNHNYFVGQTSLLAHNNNDCIVTTLQTGGRTLRNSTVKALGLTKEQAKRAIEALKDDLQVPNNFHQKIMSNGDVVNSHTGEVIGNLHHYVP